MDATRWKQLQDIFQRAVELPKDEQQAFLSSACSDDLRTEISAMLEEDLRTDSILDLNMPQEFGLLLSDQNDFQLPLQLGPYKLKELLGEGGMGVVWLAEREDTGNMVALKFLPHAALSPARRARFTSEIKTLARLKHPFIARLYDAGTTTDGTPWFAMEYVNGIQLAQYCAEKTCSIETRLRIFRSICEAVQYAHSQEVIHRDIKPSNILVESDGTPKLLDFGVAKHMSSLDATSEQTRPGLRLMTPQYSAPEWRTNGDVGFYTDVFSLGVILFELLVGRRPKDQEGNPERPSSIRQENSKLGQALSKAAWNDLDALCLKAMDPEPARRYLSVEALLRDVDHYLRNEPLEVHPDSLLYTTGKFVRRNKGPVAVASLLTILLIFTFVFFTIRLTRERNRAIESAAQAERVENFMRDMFEGGDKAGPSKDLQVSTLLERGVRNAKSLDRDPRLQSDLFLTLGKTYQQLGRLDEAESLLGLALEKRRAITPKDSERVGESLLAMGLLKLDQASLTEADKYIQMAIQEERSLDKRHPAVIHTNWALAKLLLEQGKYQTAIDLVNQTLHSFPPNGDEHETARLMMVLGEAHFSLGHYPVADGIFRDVLKRTTNMHGDIHPSIADISTDLGHVQTQLGNYSEAAKYYQKALSIGEIWYGKDHPETADFMNNLASSLYFMDRSQEAEPLAKAALEIMIRNYGEVHPRVALVLAQVGMIERDLGRLDETEIYYKRSAEIYRTVYGEKNQFYAVELNNVASVCLKRKDYACSEETFRKAISIFTEVQSPTHVHTGLARVGLGGALLGQQKYQEALTESSAGYEILKGQTNPKISYLNSARRDLAAEYEALHDEANAAKFRAELAQTKK